MIAKPGFGRDQPTRTIKEETVLEPIATDTNRHISLTPQPASKEKINRLIEEPSENTIVWKYLDFAKYMALLKTRCLHLAPATEFWDKYEGDIGVVQKKALIKKYGPETYEELKKKIQRLRQHTYVSCWTENEFESDAMWRIYTGASYGVAICSTYGRLKSLIPPLEGELACHCGKVNYVDFKKDVLALEAYSLPYFYKRRSFEHEREVRVLIQEAEPRDDEPAPSKKIQLNAQQVNDLILSVHLSPGAPVWFSELVRDVNRDYGLDREPVVSALDEVPEEFN